MLLLRWMVSQQAARHERFLPYLLMTKRSIPIAMQFSACRLPRAVRGVQSCRHSCHAKGFTLLETLVALAILAIALAAVMRASGGGINHADAMRMRVLADWVAQDRMAEHAARGDFMAVGIQNGEATEAGVTLTWKEEISETPNPAFRHIEVSVYGPDDPAYALRQLTGFLVQQRR